VAQSPPTYVARIDLRTPQPESPAQSVSSWLSGHAINLAMVAGLLVIVGFVLGAGIAGYPALAANEDNYLEQAWALNRDVLSHSTSWYDRAPLGWIGLWLMANLVGAVVSGQSAAAQGQILVLALAGVALLYVLAPGTHLAAEQLATSA
jgi:hypothetical protein